MQIIEAIELTEGTVPFNIDHDRGIRVLIVGHCSIGTLFERYVPEPDVMEMEHEINRRGILMSVMSDSVVLCECVSNKPQQYGGEMKLDISADDLERLKDAFMANGEKEQSVFELTCNRIFDDMKIDYALLDTSDRISKHPQWMNNQRMKYKAPDRRCEVVRRGKRQIRTPSP